MKISIVNYKRPHVFDTYKIENYWMTAEDKSDLLQDLYAYVRNIEPETKKIFGKEITLSLKYFLNKRQQEMENTVMNLQLKELGIIKDRNKHLNAMYYKQIKNGFLNREYKHATSKKWITFYDDVKLLDEILDLDFMYCEYAKDKDVPEYLETSLHPLIFKELKDRISKIKFWKGLGGK